MRIFFFFQFIFRIRIMSINTSHFLITLTLNIYLINKIFAFHIYFFFQITCAKNHTPIIKNNTLNFLFILNWAKNFFHKLIVFFYLFSKFFNLAKCLHIYSHVTSAFSRKISSCFNREICVFLQLDINLSLTVEKMI